MDEIRANPHGERAQRVIVLEFADGREIPVNYLHEGNKVFVGADGPWWRQLQDNGNVHMLMRGERLSGSAHVVLDDPDYQKEVFSRLRPTAPTWLPSWLEGKLVVISLGEHDE